MRASSIGSDNAPDHGRSAGAWTYLCAFSSSQRQSSWAKKWDPSSVRERSRSIDDKRFRHFRIDRIMQRASQGL
eukprot:scaffold2739_cov257-Pinguiococcus_pyrenoidosus.AAC.6